MPKILTGQTGDNNPKHAFFYYSVIKKVLFGAGTGDQGLIWRVIDPPVISSFTVSPNTIDRDVRPTGTLTFSFNITGTPNQQTDAQIVELPSGRPVGVSYSAPAGQNLAVNVPNIVQPDQTTTYRLFARNDAGQSSRDVRIDVTQNPQLSNLRRTGFHSSPTVPNAGNYTFMARLVGYPRPDITWSFGNGVHSVLNNDRIRFVEVAGSPNTWDVVFGGPAGIYHTVPNDSLNMVARNSSGSVSENLANIGA